MKRHDASKRNLSNLWVPNWVMALTCNAAARCSPAAKERHGFISSSLAQGKEAIGMASAAQMALPSRLSTVPMRGAVTSREPSIRRPYSRIKSWRTPAKITERDGDSSRIREAFPARKLDHCLPQPGAATHRGLDL